MQITGTKESFLKMISEKNVFEKLGVNRTTVSAWKIYVRQGQRISIDKMEEMLIKYGAEVVQDKVWKL